METISLAFYTLEINNAHYNETNLYLVENILFSYNNYTPWLLLVLFLNRKKLKRPIIYLMFFFWLLKYFSNICYFVSHLFLNGGYTLFKIYIVLYFLSNSRSFISEIVGDWYLLLRTKAISANKKMPLLYITCILFNLSKIGGIISSIYDCIIRYPNFLSIKALFIVQIFSLFYDLSNIYYLKKSIFKKYKTDQTETKNNFLMKIKYLSEYRLFVSIILSLFLVLFMALSFILYINNKNNKSNIFYYNNPLYIRSMVVSYNYYIMFIDQILLRFFAERNNPNYKITSTNSYMFRGNKYSHHDVNPNNSGNHSLYKSKILDFNSMKKTPLNHESSAKNLLSKIDINDYENNSINMNNDSNSSIDINNDLNSSIDMNNDNDSNNSVDINNDSNSSINMNYNSNNSLNMNNNSNNSININNDSNNYIYT